MKKLPLVALIVVVSIGVAGVGGAAPGPACAGSLTFEGWAARTADCTFTPAGEHLTAWAAGAAGGVAMAYFVPGPAIINVHVSIETMDGTTLHRCTSSNGIAAQCSRAAIGVEDRGEPLRCVVQGWSNMAQGRAAIAYGCAGL